LTLAADLVARIARRLAEHAGLELPSWVVEARASARIEGLGVAAAEYVELLGTTRGHGELVALVEAVRVGESSLFRHRQQIATLVEVVVPELRAKRKKTVTVLSAGCSAGQEPYTLAVVLARAMPEAHVSIVGWDVSSEALVEARENTFPAGALHHVPEDYHDAFELDEGGLHVIEDYAKLVRFEQRNLIERVPRVDRFDLVWCRNVLIYFSAEARRRAIEQLIEATAPDGYIFVGYSESLRDIAELAAVRNGDVAYYTRRERTSAIRLATPPVGVPIIRPSTPAIPVGAAFRDEDTGVRKARPLPTHDARIVLRGRPDAAALTLELAGKLGEAHPTVLVDFDGVDELDSSVVPVLRRASAAARAAGGQVVMYTTKSSTRGWLVRQGLIGGDE